jgi:sugar lactone lactonase YvrE
VDAAGVIYVSDTGNNTIRVMAANGTVSTLAGVAGQAGSADGTRSAARFYYPQGLAADALGILYVADTTNNTIRRITPAGVVSTLAGRPGNPGIADGWGDDARFNNPSAVTMVGTNVCVSDTVNNTLRLIYTNGLVTTLAGQPGRFGQADTTSLAATFNSPRGLAADHAGNLYVADTLNHVIRKLAPAATNGLVSTLAGPIGQPDSGSGVWHSAPGGLGLNSARVAFVADFTNCTIRQIVPGGVPVTVAGLTGVRGRADGAGSLATFDHPFAVTADPLDNLLVSDTINCSIRLLTGGAAVQVSTLVGKPGTAGSADGYGSSARFNFPCALAASGPTNFFVADYGNHTIRWVRPDKYVSTLAGSAGQPGSADGTGQNARFNFPRGVAADAAGNVFVADTGNHTIRKITPGGVVSTWAGLAGSPGSTDGAGNTARFNAPQGLALDKQGNLFVADTGNHLIRQITSSRVVTTVAGLAGASGFEDGTGSSVRFNGPGGIAAVGDRRVWVSDSVNNAIRRGMPAAPDRPVIDQSVGPVGEVRQLDIADFTATTWSWNVVRRPAGSAAELSPSGTARNPTFTPDVADLFVFQLVATNAAGEMAFRTVSLQGFAPSPGGFNPGGRGIIYGGSDSAGEIIPVQPWSPPYLSIRAVEPAHQVAVTVHSTASEFCVLLVSTNLVDWLPFIVLTNATGTGVLLDSVSNAPSRFYKVQPHP